MNGFDRHVVLNQINSCWNNLDVARWAKRQLKESVRKMMTGGIGQINSFLVQPDVSVK